MQVIGTASGEDVLYLRALGHVQVVDYKHERFESVGQVDAVLDLIGGETATRSFAVVKKGGVLVSPVHAANAVHGPKTNGKSSATVAGAKIRIGRLSLVEPARARRFRFSRAAGAPGSSRPLG